jgi:hypothetical protein
LFQVKPGSSGCFRSSQSLLVDSSRSKLCRLFQVKRSSAGWFNPSSAGCFKSSQDLQVVSSQAKLCRLFQVNPSSAGCF